TGKDHPQPIARPEAWRALLHRKARPRERIAHDEAGPSEERDLDPQLPLGCEKQFSAGFEQSAGARGFERYERTQRGTVLTAQNVLGRDAKLCKIFCGEIEASPARVLSDVL